MQVILSSSVSLIATGMLWCRGMMPRAAFSMLQLKLVPLQSVSYVYSGTSNKGHPRPRIKDTIRIARTLFDAPIMKLPYNKMTHPSVSII